MILEEFMKGAVPSERLIIEDSTGELYRGFVACLEYDKKDIHEVHWDGGCEQAAHCPGELWDRREAGKDTARAPGGTE